MSNPYYTPTGNPSALARGISAQMRNEFALIEDAFDAISAGTILSRVETRSSNTIFAAGDLGKTIEYTAGGFSQTFTSAVTLGDGWFVRIKNASATDIVTLAPSQTIDGLASMIVYPGESFMIASTGTAFKTFGRSNMVFVNEIAFSAVSSVAITSPFSDAEITGMDVSLYMVATGTGLQPTLSVGGWSNMAGGEINQLSTTVAASGVSTSLILESGMNTGSVLTSEFQWRNINNTTAYVPTLFIHSLRGGDKQKIHSLKNSVSAAPSSMIVTTIVGTLAGSYAMTLYRGRNV